MLGYDAIGNFRRFEGKSSLCELVGEDDCEPSGRSPLVSVYKGLIVSELQPSLIVVGLLVQGSERGPGPSSCVFVTIKKWCCK